MNPTQLDIYAQWLDSLSGKYPWSFFLTATCPAGERRTARSWRRSMERTMLQPYLDGCFKIEKGFWGLERQKSGSVHAHGLIQVTDVYGMYLDGSGEPWETDTISQIATDIWSVLFQRFGRSECLPFDPQLGATHYVGKYCFKDVVKDGDLDWDFYVANSAGELN